MTKQLIFINPEPLTKYLINYKGKDFECWYSKQGFIHNYHILEESKVIIIKRIGKPEEVFNEYL